MTLLAGVFIALGISAYILLWRYIFLQFFKLVKPYEDDQDSLHEAGSNFFDFLLSNCTNTSNKNQQKSSQIVTNISTEEQFVDLTSKPFSDRVLKEVEHYENILDAYKPLKLCLRSRIGRCGKSMVTEKDKSIIPELRDMQAVDDDAKDTQSPGNPELRDVSEGVNTFEVMKCDATFLSLKPNVQLGGEEQDLNTMIRRLVAAELIKCCEKKHGAMNRAHSDTNNRVNWKRNKYNKQAVNLDLNLSSYGESHPVSKESVCDFGNPGSAFIFSSSPEKYTNFLGKRIESEVTPKFLIENAVEVDHNCDFKGDDGANEESGIKSLTIVEDDVSILCKGRKSDDGTNESLENEDVASIGRSETQMIRTTTTADRTLQSIEIVGKFEDASTQTEHMYMIRAVRSCPVRKSRVQLLGTSRGMSKARTSGKLVSTETFTLPTFLYRKASDNLIYEMGKGSRSPSYIPVPERFRWRYVTPTKVD